MLFANRAATPGSTYGPFLSGVRGKLERIIPGMMGGYQGQALNQLLVVMDGIDEPPAMRKFMTNRMNTFLDAMFIVPSKVGKVSLRMSPPRVRPEQIYFIGACNVPIEVLDPALTRPGRMGRHSGSERRPRTTGWTSSTCTSTRSTTSRTSTRRTAAMSWPASPAGYSPAMIEQCCSMALTIAHSEGRREFGWRDIVEAMTTVETGTAQNIEYIQEETRAVAIHEAGHAAAGHVFLEKEFLSTRLSIRKRGGSLGHYQSMEKDERFSHFRSHVMGTLIMTLGAMAAEHVFFGENSQGVGGDVGSATMTAAAMVGYWAMGPDPVHIGGSMEADEDLEHVLARLERIGNAIMNRASGGAALTGDPVASILGDRDKRRAAAQILGQAYVTAYALIANNREPVERIADTLIHHKEMHGDEVVDLLNAVGLQRPEVDLMDDRTWPKV